MSSNDFEEEDKYIGKEYRDTDKIKRLEAEILLLFEYDVYTENDVGYVIDELVFLLFDLELRVPNDVGYDLDEPLDVLVGEALNNLVEKELLIKNDEYYTIPEDVEQQIRLKTICTVMDSNLFRKGRTILQEGVQGDD